VWVSTTSRPSLSRRTVLSRYVCVWVGVGVSVGVSVNHIKACIITADRVVTVCVGVGGCECGCGCPPHQGRHYHGRPCCHGMCVWVGVGVSVGVSVSVNHIKACIITADRVVTVCVGVGGCECGCGCPPHQGRHYHGRPCCHGMCVWV